MCIHIAWAISWDITKTRSGNEHLAKKSSSNQMFLPSVAAVSFPFMCGGNTLSNLPTLMFMWSSMIDAKNGTCNSMAVFTSVSLVFSLMFFLLYLCRCRTGLSLQPRQTADDQPTGYVGQSTYPCVRLPPVSTQ